MNPFGRAVLGPCSVAVVLLAACAAPPVAEEPAVDPALAEAPQLRFALIPPKSGYEEAGYLPYFTASASFSSLFEIASIGEVDSEHFDVILRVTDSEGAIEPYETVEAISAHSRHALTSFETTRSRAGEATFKAFRPGTDLYKQVVAERGAPAAAPTPDAAEAAAPEPSSDVDAPSYKRDEDPNAYALIVGVESYPRLPAARFAERDARAVRDHLVSLGVPERNAVLLVGAEASRAGLAKNLETWLARNAGPESTVYFYYSGHGAPDPVKGRAYLMPADADPQYLSDTAYPLARVYEKLAALKAKRVVALVDACFSGAGGRSVIAPGTRPLVTKVEAGAPAGGSVVALTAARADEVSGSADDQGHGLFTYHLLKGLNGEAAGEDGAVTLRGLYDYLKPRVADAARRANREQTPQLLNGAAAAEIRLR